VVSNTIYAITVTAKTIDEFKANVKILAQELGLLPADGQMPLPMNGNALPGSDVETQPVNSLPTEPEKKKPGRPKKALAPAAEAPAQEPDEESVFGEAPAPKAAATATKQDAEKAARDLYDGGNNVAGLKTVLKSFGAGSLKDLSPDKYVPFIDACKQAMTAH
jgi:hypothetical protein